MKEGDKMEATVEPLTYKCVVAAVNRSYLEMTNRNELLGLKKKLELNKWGGSFKYEKKTIF